MKTYKVKICGTTSIEDARMAIDAGADYLGVLVNVPISERSLTIEQAKAIVESSKIPVLILLYGLNADEITIISDIIKPYGIHLLGNTDPNMVKELKTRLSCKVWLTIYLPVKGQGEVDVNSIKGLMKAYENAGADAIVIDTVKTASDSGIKRYGGTGMVADWDIAKDLIGSASIPVFLAGGINPDNVKEALRKVDPYGVDLASGVEKVKCKRDPEKVRKLMQAIREVSAEKMQDNLKIISQSPEQTILIGKEIGKIAFPGCVIALCGELGSGKTVFAKGLAEGLGVDSFVTSPTFVLINEYSGRYPFYHFDVYRIKAEDMHELGYEEYFYGDGVTAIEWAQKISELLPDEYLRIDFEYISESARQILLIGYGEKYANLIKKIKSLGEFY